VLFIAQADVATLERFRKSSELLFKHISAPASKFQNLRQTRDLFLPKLRSREVKVSELAV
jgi:hypothetical protein